MHYRYIFRLKYGSSYQIESTEEVELTSGDRAEAFREVTIYVNKNKKNALRSIELVNVEKVK